MPTHSGFNRDAAGKPITVDVSAQVGTPTVHQGYLRDGNYSLVTKASPTTPIIAQGWRREGGNTNYYALVSIAPGSAQQPVTTMQGGVGTQRDALGRIVV